MPPVGSDQQLTRADFDNSSVLNAVNPDPNNGYAHGPIPDNNPGWKPAAYFTAIASGDSKYAIRTVDLQSPPPPNPPVILNRENTGVCDVAIKGELMCGMTFSDGTKLWYHIRQKHSGAVAVARSSGKSDFEIEAGQNAIKRWILCRGWQRASYIHEPGRGPPNGIVGAWCDALERIAAGDAQFAAQYGTRFHRYSAN